jgi:hypothetical protein
LTSVFAHDKIASVGETKNTKEIETMNVQIVGYTKMENCDHCGRPLQHVIKLDNGMQVGATCFNNKLTKAKVYGGRKYRVGANKIIELAKMIQFWTPEKLDRMGVREPAYTFEWNG